MPVLEDTLSKLDFGPTTEWENLALTPLLREPNPRSDYRTLDEALAEQTARITEVSEGGSVPELEFTNEGDCPVFLLDGEELLGAKQNRVLNLSILAPAGKTLKIPVSCVEAGRWTHTSQEFAAAPRAHYAEGRARKMAQVSGMMYQSAGRSHQSNQGEVWRDISRKAACLDTSSPTAAMAAIFEKHEDSVERYVEAFSAQENQVGAAFSINGKVVGVELFDCPETFGKLLPKLLRSYALDAVEKREEPREALSQSSVATILEAAKAAKQERFAAVGLGADMRLDGNGITGAALEYEDRLVHLSVFRTPEKTPAAEAPMQSRPRRWRM